MGGDHVTPRQYCKLGVKCLNASQPSVKAKQARRSAIDKMTECSKCGKHYCNDVHQRYDCYSAHAEHCLAIPVVKPGLNHPITDHEGTLHTCINT